MRPLHIAALVGCALLCVGWGRVVVQPSGPKRVASVQPSGQNAGVAVNDSSIGRAFKNKTSHFQVEGEGVVSRILADDLAGSRHQRFILRLASGQTLLIAHNIDIAPRVANLQEGDRVRFYGEYVWNEKGGMIHWTHHDPEARHIAGWLKHNGQTYR